MCKGEGVRGSGVRVWICKGGGVRGSGVRVWEVRMCKGGGVGVLCEGVGGEEASVEVEGVWCEDVEGELGYVQGLYPFRLMPFRLLVLVRSIFGRNGTSVTLQNRGTVSTNFGSIRNVPESVENGSTNFGSCSIFGRNSTSIAL